MAWAFFSDGSADVFRSSLALDDAAWSRGRGWALWKAVIHLAREKQGGPDSSVAARRWGWRFSAREVITAVLAEHRASI